MPSETDYGVPIPGEVLPPECWTRTAIKKLPPRGPLDFQTIFGRAAPLILDLGCGNGRFLLASALARRECDHIGLDILPVVIRYATRRANQRGLTNARLIVCGAHEFLEQYVPPGAVAEIHLYHPQPYKDENRAFKRLITPEFLALAHRSLAAGGLFVVQTDNRPYWNYIRQNVPAFFEFREQRAPWPDAPRGRTRREIYAICKGLPVLRGWGTKRPLTSDQIASLLKVLPRPAFDARPRQ